MTITRLEAGREVYQFRTFHALLDLSVFMTPSSTSEDSRRPRQAQ
ncbi:UNVERIFIED_CONTAM: hypothetical protein GTU68_025942 [Idotea baltica]|nr:hypothetical protein [Idotea baltica]